jgi:hypothetical protein
VDGVEQWTQVNLVHTELIIFNPTLPAGIKHVWIGIDNDERPIYKYEEVMEAVLIAEYRTPSLEDEVKAQRKQIKILNV